MEIKLNVLDVILNAHTNFELRKLYEKLFSKKPNLKMTQYELIKAFQEDSDLSHIISIWEQNFAVFNSSLKILKVRDRNNNLINLFSRINGISEIIDVENIPDNLSVPSVLYSKLIGNRFYIIFGEKQKQRTVIDSMTYRTVVQPMFTTIVLNSNGVIEVRGSSRSSKVLSCLRTIFSFEATDLFYEIYIQDKNQLQSLAADLNGRVEKVKIEDSDDLNEIDSAELTAKPTISIFDSEIYDDLIAKGFQDSAGGVEFINQDGEAITIWVGFSSKTIWLKKGSVSESDLSRIITSLLVNGNESEF